MIRICKKIVIFKLSTDLKYLEVVQGGGSPLFFTYTSSITGAVQRKHILKVKKFLKRMITNLIGVRVNWVNYEVGYHYVWIRVLSAVHVRMYWCTCYNYDATIRWTWYDSNDFFGSARPYGVLGCL